MLVVNIYCDYVSEYDLGVNVIMLWVSENKLWEVFYIRGIWCNVILENPCVSTLKKEGVDFDIWE